MRIKLNGGKFDVELRNSLPFSLKAVHVFLGAWTFGRQQNRGNQIQERDFYQVLTFENVAARASASQSQPVNLQIESWDCSNRIRQVAQAYHRQARPGFAAADLPRVNVRGRLQGYLIARIDRSPHLKINGTSFDSTEGVHVVVQRIPDRHLPDSEGLSLLFSVMAKQYEEQQKKARGN